MAEAAVQSNANRFYCHQCTEEINPKLPVSRFDGHTLWYLYGKLNGLLSIIVLKNIVCMKLDAIRVNFFGVSAVKNFPKMKCYTRFWLLKISFSK